MRRRGSLSADALSLLVLAAATLFLFRGLLDDHALKTHDRFFPYLRAVQMAKELAAGHYPQVFPDAIHGAGYAFPRFYPPLTLWISTGLATLAGNVCLGVNLAFLLSVLASAATMYAAAALVVRDRRLALASALVYISLPYRFVDVFARGALAEAWSFVWFPVVFAGLWRLAVTRRLPWYLPVGVALLVLSHSLLALYFLVFCVALGTTLTWRDRTTSTLAALGIALGLGLAAFAIVPQQIYLSTVWASDQGAFWSSPEQIRANSPALWQLFLPANPFENGADLQALRGLDFQLGTGQLLWLLVGALLANALRRGTARAGRRLRAANVVVAAAWLVSVAFVVWPVAFLTVLPRQFAYIQFSWRLLAIAGFLAALGLAMFARQARIGRTGVWALCGAAILVVALVPAASREKWTAEVWNDAGLLTPEGLRDAGTLGYTIAGEYLPREFDVNGYVAAGQPDGPAFEAPRVDGQGALLAWRKTGLDVRATVDSEHGCDLVLPLVYYDVYRATASSGAPLATYSAAGMLGVRVPPGTTTVDVTHGVTPPVIVGIAASALSAVLGVFVCVAGRRRRHGG